MPADNSHKSFGKYLNAVMRDRGFKSDEQLARRAMQFQEQLSPRVNVQRRTINNWRNNKTTPRNISDQQFNLVAIALKLSDDEVGSIAKLIEGQSTAQGPAGTSNAIQSQPVWLRPSLIGLVCIVIITAIALFWQETIISYLETIPPTQLRVSNDGFVIPNSGGQVVSERQLEKFSGWELYVARNEIFARKGPPFVKMQSICLQNHFDSWSKSSNNLNGWYNKISGNVHLTDLEYRNAKIIQNYECKTRGGQYNCTGKLNGCF